MTTSNLSNINFMSLAQYNALETKNSNEIYNVECAVVVNSYNDGTNWFRKWSDGWVEQGGIVPLTMKTVTLMLGFQDENYTLLLTPYIGTNATVWVSERKTTTFSWNVYTPAGTVNNVLWNACGKCM